MSSDRQWIYNRLTNERLNQKFIDGLEKFIDFASSQLEWMEGIKLDVQVSIISVRTVCILI